MGLAWNIVRVAMVAVTVVAVAELSKRYPRYAAVLLSLPLVSILAFLLGWLQHKDMLAISRLARETLVLVPLGLPFFVPFAFAEQLGWGFWSSLVAGTALASVAVGGWVYFGPSV